VAHAVNLCHTINNNQLERIIMIVTIANEVSSKTLEEIEAYIAGEVMHNPNMNGERVHIDRDDYTSVDGCNAYAAASLLVGIHNILG